MKVCLFADARSVHIRQLVRALVSRGLTVHVVTHKPAELPGASVERFSVPPPGMTNLQRWDGRRRSYLQGFLRHFDVVNVHFLADWGLEECFAKAGSSRAAVVASAWGSDIVDPPQETPATTEQVRARVRLLRSADAVTVCGPTFARTVARYADLPTEFIEVVPFGVDLGLFTHPVTRSPDGSDVLRVGFFKGFRAVYGPLGLIRAIPAVVAQFPNVRFDLIGDGAQLASCQAAARELGVESVIDWIPRQDHAFLPVHLSRWDVSVIPSVHEAFGVAALESSAMCVPVIASNVDGLRDTVRGGETGILVPPEDPKHLAEAVVHLLRDGDLRKRMGEAGRRMVEREYDWRTLGDQWAALYRRVREQRCVMA